MRRLFFIELWNGLKIVWPIVSGLLGMMALLGAVIGWRRGLAAGRCDLFRVRALA